MTRPLYTIAGCDPTTHAWLPAGSATPFEVDVVDAPCVPRLGEIIEAGVLARVVRVEHRLRLHHESAEWRSEILVGVVVTP